MTSEAPARIPQDDPPAPGPVDQDALGSREQLLTWLVAVLPFMLPLVLSCLAGRWRDGAGSAVVGSGGVGSGGGSGWPGWRVRPVFLLLVPLLAFVNGAAHYLGLKTVGVYSMFSNPRVEYLRDGTPRVATDAITDPVLSARPSWWRRNLLAFRAIDSGLGANICRW